MSFIKIKKGSKKMSVTTSAYDNFYKNAGWQKDEVDAKSVENESINLDELNDEIGPVLEEEIVDDEVVDDEWAEYEDEEIEKPLSEMTDAELRKKANSLGINTKGLSVKQIRERIKNHSA